jgi:hypothetical protein
MFFNVTMPRKTRIRPPKKRGKSPDDSLRILASLIAQFHIKKISYDKKQQIQDNGLGDTDNG